VCPRRYELGFYIPEDGIIHDHRRENLESYIALTGWAQYRRRNVSLVKYELGFRIPDDGLLHSHRRENLKCYMKCIYLWCIALTTLFPFSEAVPLCTFSGLLLSD
jgi:hypothetical protein